MAKGVYWLKCFYKVSQYTTISCDNLAALLRRLVREIIEGPLIDGIISVQYVRWSQFDVSKGLDRELFRHIKMDGLKQSCKLFSIVTQPTDILQGLMRKLSEASTH